MSAAGTSERVLVTGAGGCIGGRLVEKLVLERDAPVRALVRNWQQAIRLARFDVDIRRGDIGDAEAVGAAVEGCGTVIHCAYDWSGHPKNIAAARGLIDACLNHRVRRVVFVSSISVYEPLPDGELTESAPRVQSGWAYPDTKLELEHLFQEAHDAQGLPVVVVEPTVVYGPYSRAWTLGPIEQLRWRRVILPDAGEGISNAVYVDDVAESLILATEADAAVGERVLVSGPGTVTWRDLFHAYEDTLGVEALVFMPARQIEEHLRASDTGVQQVTASIRRDPRALLRTELGQRALAAVRPLISARFEDAARRKVPPRLAWPDDQQLALYRSRAAVNDERARKLLGYRPTVPFEEGMSLTREFLDWHLGRNRRAAGT